MRVVVAGGTGTVGRYVVEAARARSHEVVVLSRRDGVDVLTGDGLVAAMDGADVVVDVTNITTASADDARRFFETGTRNLLAAETEAGVGHHLALSIVGIDGNDESYYAGKLAQERMVAAADVPHTIARAPQFHEFATGFLAGQTGPVVVLPRVLMRPAAAREVGAHVIDVAEAGPVGRATDFVGPRDEVLADVARRQLAFDGIDRTVEEVLVPGAYGEALASGVLRGSADAIQATVTFDEWLRSADHARPA